MLIDIFLLSAIIVASESRIVGKSNYIVFSPLFLFLSAYNLLYILPAVLTSFDFGSILTFSNLPVEYYSDYLFYNRAFFYSFSFVFLMYFLSIKKKKLKRKISMEIRPGWVIFVLLISVVIKYLYLGTGLAWNPVLVFERIIFPREFTYIKEGTGLINYLQASLTLASFFLATVNYFQKKNCFNAFLMAFAAILFFAGGAKQSLVWLAFIYIIVAAKINIHKDASTLKNLKYILLILAIIVASFSIMVVRADSRSLLEKLTKYQEEAYNSALVLGDYSWEPEYTINGLVDTLIAPVPRKVWSGKPYVGFYKRYWQPRYEANAVIFQTSTYGFISESHMMLGAVGPFVYALLFSFLVIYCYLKILGSQRIFPLMVALYLSTFFYFLLRTGFTGFIVINIGFAIFVFYQTLRKVYSFRW